MKKITFQQIADALALSRVTVWKALNNKPGINPATKSSVVMKALEMGYPINLLSESETVADVTPENSNFTGCNIAVAISRPETSTFWLNIIHHESMLLSKYGINLIYVYIPSYFNEDYVLPESLTNGSVRGMIVMNIYDARLFMLLNKLPIIKVFLDCPPELSFSDINGDLFLLEGISSINQITEHMIEKGKTRLRFVGDISYAQSNRERYLGFTRAMQRHQLPIPDDMQLIHAIDMNQYPETIHQYLDRVSSESDGFVCSNDYNASIIINYLQDKGIAVPEEILVSGFDDISEFESMIPITTVHVNTDQVGIRLAERIIHRLRYPHDDFEYTYIRNHAIFRASTDAD